MPVTRSVNQENRRIFLILYCLGQPIRQFAYSNRTNKISLLQFNMNWHNESFKLPRPAPNSMKHVFSWTRSAFAKCPSKDAVCNKCLLASGPYIGLFNSSFNMSCVNISSGISGNLSIKSTTIHDIQHTFNKVNHLYSWSYFLPKEFFIFPITTSITLCSINDRGISLRHLTVSPKLIPLTMYGGCASSLILALQTFKCFFNLDL